MKQFYAILCVFIASLTQLPAQAPQGVNYQATVRNNAGDLIVNTNVYFRLNIIQGSQTAVPIFTETHYVPTDDLGQVNLVIGQGTATTGTFSELDWSLGSYYLGIELDTGSGYVAMGTTQLLSVPYALYAESSGNSTPTTPSLETVLAENNSANNQQIKDLQDPTDAQDAVTKNYTDTQFYTQSEVDAMISSLQGQIDDLNSSNESGTVTDQDGNTYDYITYGDQDWTVANAEMVTYRDGTPIPQVTDATEWSNLTTGAWCYYDNDPTKGKLYNWYAVAGIHDTDPNTPNKELAPEGWHVPSDAEWTTLEEYLIANGYNYDGTTTENKIAKAMASTTGWNSTTNAGAPGNDQSLNNSSGFKAFPEGYRSSTNGSFFSEGGFAFFWSFTESNSDLDSIRFLEYDDSDLQMIIGYPKQGGFSVRFVRDSEVDQSDVDNDDDGYTENQGDCDDANGNVFPEAPELEDGIDNDCDGAIDEDFANLPSNLGLVGNATENGWFGPDTPLVYQSNGIYEALVNFVDGEFKIRQNNDWDNNWGDTDADGTLDQDGANIAVVAGMYLVTVNWLDMTYTLQQINTTLPYGTQIWSTTNAEIVTYRDGTPIPQVTDNTEWENLTTGAWCYYDNASSKGKLYNWYAVMGIHDTDPNTPNKEFAPEGWHVPSDAEWTTLENYLIANGYNYDDTTTENKIAKSIASTTGWISSTTLGAPGNNQSLNNSSGFNALPVGWRSSSGPFVGESDSAFFWSSSESDTNNAWGHFLSNASGIGFWRDYSSKQFGRSVRFVRD